MNVQFQQAVDSLEPSFRELMEMPPVSVNRLPINIPGPGVYLFSEGDSHLYAGRAARIKERVRQHCRESSSPSLATFAYRLATQVTGLAPIPGSPNSSRSSLLGYSEFAKAFLEQKKRIEVMQLRYVSQPDPIRQALLEMYVAITLNTEHNEFA